MEMVRTFLAGWILTRPRDAPDPNWTPLLPIETLEFSYNPNHDSFIWECQCLLQETIANKERIDQDMAAYPHTLMLFILEFPGTGNENYLTESNHSIVQSSNSAVIPDSQEISNDPDGEDDDGESVMFSFMSPFAPQDIKVVVDIIHED